jgi:RNA polymerase sigma-70 factor (ECF subfamily)
LERECEAGGKGALFRQMKGLLTGEGNAAAYVEMGRRVGMSEGAMYVAVHRLRQRYGELLRNEVAQTVSSPEEIDEEMRFLMSVLSG